jgi:hypothetical protein
MVYGKGKQSQHPAHAKHTVPSQERTKYRNIQHTYTTQYRGTRCREAVRDGNSGALAEIDDEEVVE